MNRLFLSSSSYFCSIIKNILAILIPMGVPLKFLLSCAASEAGSLPSFFFFLAPPSSLSSKINSVSEASEPLLPPAAPASPPPVLATARAAPASAPSCSSCSWAEFLTWLILSIAACAASGLKPFAAKLAGEEKITTCVTFSIGTANRPISID